MIELRNIRKSFTVGPTALEVLKGVDLTITSGDLVAVVGTSGSGKSTLMSILGLLDTPSSGGYRLAGEEVSQLADEQLSTVRNRDIGFVFQSFQLLPRLTAADNVGLPMLYASASPEEIRARSLELLRAVGLEDRADHRPHELSGGQQQRVAIARALSNRPRLVLADEPTGALDPRVGSEIMELFLRLNREQGLTLILITHDPGVAARCDRVFEMSDGRLLPEQAGDAYAASPQERIA